MAERPEDLNLPAAVVLRLIKQALPDSCAVSKEARQAVCRAASVFVLYLTSQANALALQNKRKTLVACDVLAALKEMELEEFVEPLTDSLEQFRKNRQPQQQNNNNNTTT